LKRKALALTLAMALIFSFLFYGIHIQPVESQSLENIIIKTDGSVDPPTAPITQTGNVYTMTGNILGSAR
jgi:hypothetical protein